MIYKILKRGEPDLKKSINESDQDTLTQADEWAAIQGYHLQDETLEDGTIVLATFYLIGDIEDYRKRAITFVKNLSQGTRQEFFYNDDTQNKGWNNYYTRTSVLPKYFTKKDGSKILIDCQFVDMVTDLFRQESYRLTSLLNAALTQEEIESIVANEQYPKAL